MDIYDTTHSSLVIAHTSCAQHMYNTCITHAHDCTNAYWYTHTHCLHYLRSYSYSHSHTYTHIFPHRHVHTCINISTHPCKHKLRLTYVNTTTQPYILCACTNTFAFMQVYTNTETLSGIQIIICMHYYYRFVLEVYITTIHICSTTFNRIFEQKASLGEAKLISSVNLAWRLRKF